MKRLLIAMLLIIIPVLVVAQVAQQTVNTFDGRSGRVTMRASDVYTALTYTPAPLDDTGKVPVVNLPPGWGGSVGWGGITGSLSDQVDLWSLLSSKLSSTGSGALLTGITSTQVGLGSVENTKLSTWPGSLNITTLGVISSGTWSSTPIDDAHIASAAIWNAKQSALGFTPVPNTLTINNHALSTNLNLTTSDIGAEPVISAGTNTHYWYRGDKTFAQIPWADIVGLDTASTHSTGYFQTALGFTPIPNTRNVCGHALSSDVTCTAGDVGAEPSIASGGTHSVWHGNKTWSAVDLSSEVTNSLSSANMNGSYSCSAGQVMNGLTLASGATCTAGGSGGTISNPTDTSHDQFYGWSAGSQAQGYFSSMSLFDMSTGTFYYPLRSTVTATAGDTAYDQTNHRLLFSYGTGTDIFPSLASATTNSFCIWNSTQIACATALPLINLSSGVTGSLSLSSLATGTLTQGTTGSAATLTTPRAIYGNNFDGSAALTQVVAGTYGGTGVNNGTKTITLGGNLATTGSYTTTFGQGANVTINLPTSAGTYTMTQTVGSGTVSLGTATINTGACASAVQTANFAGIATTDSCGHWSFNGDPTGVTGYAPSSNGMLTIISYPTSGYCNFKVCNNTSANITPGAITLNWIVTR